MWNKAERKEEGGREGKTRMEGRDHGGRIEEMRPLGLGQGQRSKDKVNLYTIFPRNFFFW